MTSPDAVLDALYANLSDVRSAELRALFHPFAVLIRASDPLTHLTVEQWLEGLPAFFADKLERETSRSMTVTGTIAQALSGYEIATRASRSVVNVGLNSLLLVREHGAWRIAAAAWTASVPVASPVAPAPS